MSYDLTSKIYQDAGADRERQLLLRQAQQTATTTQALAQVQVDIGGHGDDPQFVKKAYRFGAVRF